MRERFLVWYDDEFRYSELYQKMAEVTEGSPWHREDNVALHTDMVVESYLNTTPRDWTMFELRGALACAFHDVGKPDKMEIKESLERGTYRSFSGHELVSARLWEDYAVANWDRLTQLFGLESYDVYVIGFAVEQHLPFGLKDKYKVENLALSIKNGIGMATFENVIFSDQTGRISDDHAEKLANVGKWMFSFKEKVEASAMRLVKDDAPLLYMPIGVSGSGKTRYFETMRECCSELDQFSLDLLRLNWYNNDYSVAWRMSIEDKEFNRKSQHAFVELCTGKRNIYVDTAIRVRKNRRFYLDLAKRRGYRCVGILFISTLDFLQERNRNREDKYIGPDTVLRQYYSLQLPQYGEFDEIRIRLSNFPV